MLIYVATQIDGDPTDEQVELAVDMLKLLADSTRLRIVWALVHGEHSVNELASHLGVNAAGVSQHLAKLRLARLVTVRREAIGPTTQPKTCTFASLQSKRSSILTMLSVVR